MSIDWFHWYLHRVLHTICAFEVHRYDLAKVLGMPKRRQRPGSKTIAKKLNRKPPTPLPDTSPTPSVLLRNDRALRGSTPLYDKEVDFINKNPAQHPPSPSVTPSTVPSSLSSSTYTQSRASAAVSRIQCIKDRITLCSQPCTKQCRAQNTTPTTVWVFWKFE